MASAVQEKGKQMRISQRAARGITIIAVIGACAAGVSAYTVTQGSAAPAPGTCAATQPVYSNNDNQQVGTWQATLTVGQEVFLPDEDVATCQKDGTLDVEQP